MTWQGKAKWIAAALLIAFLAGVNVGPVSAQKGKGGFGGTSQAEVAKLRAEVARLRADLDAALKDIAALKAALSGGKVAPEQGPFYRGRPASYWQEQLKDADAATRLDAVEALGALAEKDKKLIPVLIDTAKKDKDIYVLDKAIKGLGLAGPEALPGLIELLNDKPGFQQTIVRAMDGMGPKAKPAVPALVKLLKKKTHPNVLRAACGVFQKIGPDAREAIPGLVEVLGFCLEDIGNEKAQRSGAMRFGTTPMYLNVSIVQTLTKLDPNLAGEVKLPPFSEQFRSSRSPSKEAQEAWRKAHEALVKRYLKAK